MSEQQKVLVVDDEPRNQRIVLEVLEGLADFKVVSSGEEALQIVESYQPDLILLDIMMPGINGYDVCKNIKNNPRCAFTKIILVSGKAMVDERLQGYESGADDYITKPFVPDELQAKIKVFLRLTMMERQLGELNESLEEKVQERTHQLLEAEEKLITAAKMSALGEMAGGIAHEINTPLSVINLLAEQIKDLIVEDPVDVDIISEKAVKVVAMVKRISAIIQGLRTFSRDGSKDQFSSTPIKQIIENTLVLCNEKLKHQEIKLIVEEIPDGFEAYCQPVQISQVLLNLISNSCDAIHLLEDKWIKLAVEKQKDILQISVTDSGSGIVEEVQKKLFQPFFTTKEIGKGTGLGLSISKGIIDAHSGTLTVDNNCQHTRFLLGLPIRGNAQNEKLKNHKVA